MIIFCGFERRPHDVQGDLTATLPRPYYDYCVSTASLRRPLQNAVKRRTSATTFNMFKVVALGSRLEQFSASSLRPLASLLRPSGVYGVLTATSVALKTQ
ncbi:hypothetical protein DPMN_014521 [Dreissena polymorpha]|uniref:Uncharacterized protein n=1 Tax=Dreissena polymorpha TaxID=45954 RepID=A0A9D4N9V0_DREPO|nr:hypothetical protein DPMN_014521 [Dreissena polymorpha]